MTYFSALKSAEKYTRKTLAGSAKEADRAMAILVEMAQDADACLGFLKGRCDTVALIARNISERKLSASDNFAEAAADLIRAETQLKKLAENMCRIIRQFFGELALEAFCKASGEPYYC